ncbi:hypothetical protein E8E11_001740 [Didymella keratinophila]|nr:hypothetical protein E8E11_001740 [Didymella keratinophila]
MTEHTLTMDIPPYPNEDEGPRILGATLTVTAAALSWSVCQTINIPEVYYGAGRHMGHVSQDAYELELKLNFSTQPIFL